MTQKVEIMATTIDRYRASLVAYEKIQQARLEARSKCIGDMLDAWQIKLDHTKVRTASGKIYLVTGALLPKSLDANDRPLLLGKLLRKDGTLNDYQTLLHRSWEKLESGK
jgi:hypothetical protein